MGVREIAPFEAEMLSQQKDLQPGDVAYWVSKNSILGWSVQYGIVDDVWSDAIIVNKIRVPDFRTVDGVPIKEFVTPTEWKKLPKGWSYDTRLFEIDYNTPDWVADGLSDVQLNDPDGIKEAYKKGGLVDASIIDDCQFHTEIEHGKFRIVRSYDKSSSYTIALHKGTAYSSYEDALAVVEAEKAECKRVAELSDYEYSIEEMERVFARFIEIYGDRETSYVEKSRKFLLDQKNVEDILVRIIGEHLEWRYDKNKKWVSLPE